MLVNPAMRMSDILSRLVAGQVNTLSVRTSYPEIP